MTYFYPPCCDIFLSTDGDLRHWWCHNFAVLLVFFFFFFNPRPAILLAWPRIQYHSPDPVETLNDWSITLTSGICLECSVPRGVPMRKKNTAQSSTSTDPKTVNATFINKTKSEILKSFLNLIQIKLKLSYPNIPTRKSRSSNFPYQLKLSQLVPARLGTPMLIPLRIMGFS